MVKISNLVEWAFSGTYDEDKKIFIDAERPERSLTKAKTVELVSKLAGCFRADSTVCVHAGNEILYPVLVLAIWASECRWTGSSPASTATELSHHLELSEAKYIITDPLHLKTVNKAVEMMPEESIEVVLLTDILNDTPTTQQMEQASSHGCATLHERLNKEGDSDSLWTQLRAIHETSAAALMSTSGTTGLPKMTQRSHEALIMETLANEDNNADKPYPVIRLYCTPIYHGFSFPEMVIEALRLGVTSYYSKRFDPSFPHLVEKFEITETAAAAPMLLALTEQAASDPEVGQKMQSLRMILCGGAALLPELRSRFLGLFSRPPRLVQVWGMTEYGWVASFKYPEVDETGSVGRMNHLGTIRTAETASTDVQDGEPTISEIWVKGPQMMTEYRGNPSATADAFTEDGWLRTGDLGYLKDGKIYLSGRNKDLIKVDGLAVSPSELEAALYKSQDVTDAAAVGTGQGTEEHPVIFVVPANGELSVKDVKKSLLQHVANFKVAKCEVRFVEAIPKGPSGKILRNDLRRLLCV